MDLNAASDANVSACLNSQWTNARISLDEAEAELSGRPRRQHLDPRMVGGFAFFRLYNQDPCSCYSANSVA